ncbi:hypothetical protein JW887_07140 [Candidatus Dojkabacteria bacterium]|nr:hypothetical protein [Candidatus Dojkabacteria bacterium]
MKIQNLSLIIFIFQSLFYSGVYSLVYGGEESSGSDLRKVISDYKRKLVYIDKVKMSDKNDNIKNKAIRTAQNKIDEYKNILSACDPTTLKAIIIEYLDDEQKAVDQIKLSIERGKYENSELLKKKVPSIKIEQLVIQELLKVYCQYLQKKCESIIKEYDYPVQFNSYVFNYDFEKLDIDKMMEEKYEAEISRHPVEETGTPLRRDPLEKVSLDYTFGTFTYKLAGTQPDTLESINYHIGYKPELYRQILGSEFVKVLEDIQKDAEKIGLISSIENFYVFFDEENKHVQIEYGFQIPPVYTGKASRKVNGLVIVTTTVLTDTEKKWIISEKSAKIHSYPFYEISHRCSSCNGKGYNMNNYEFIESEDPLTGDPGGPTSIQYKTDCIVCGGTGRITEKTEEHDNPSMINLLRYYQK